MQRQVMRRGWLGAGALLAVTAGGIAVHRADPTPGPRTLVTGTFGAIAVDSGTGRVFVVANSETDVSVLDSRSGQVLNSLPVGADLDGLAMDARHGRVFVVGRGGDGHGTSPLWSVGDRASGIASVLDARSGALRQTIAVGPDPDEAAVDALSGQLLVQTFDTTLTTLDGSSGAVRHVTWVGTGLMALAADARRGHVFLVNNAGTVTMLDARSGAHLRTVTVGQSPAAITIDERAGRAYVVDAGNSTVSIIDTATGGRLGTVAVAENPTAAAVDERTGRVFVTSWGSTDRDGNPTGPGRLSVLDGHSARILNVMFTGIAPNSVAVDGATGHVFIVNGGGALPARDSWTWVPTWLRRWLPFLSPQSPGTQTVPGSVTSLDSAHP